MSNKKGSNKAPRTRRSFGRDFKILVAEEALSTPGATYRSVGLAHNVSNVQVRYWTIQYTRGFLNESNAVAFSTRPQGTQGKKNALANKRNKKKPS